VKGGRSISEGRTVYLSGYGARLHVKGGNLQVSSGRTYSTQAVESEMLYKGIHGVSTLVWLTNGGAGVLTLEAIKWCASQGITVRLLTNRGEHLGTLYPLPTSPRALGVPGQESGRPDVALRRAQYALEPNGQDVPLARAIILRKLASQRMCLEKHPELLERDKGLAAIDMAQKWLSLENPTSGNA
jgi:CRISPR/Cas system-associated endonuclease Cas1